MPFSLLLPRGPPACGASFCQDSGNAGLPYFKSHAYEVAISLADSRLDFGPLLQAAFIFAKDQKRYWYAKMEIACVWGPPKRP